ncbi:hypothetical protein SRHO_G00246030 [Serrasalmus rhombeus]
MRKVRKSKQTNVMVLTGQTEVHVCEQERNGLHPKSFRFHCLEQFRLFLQCQHTSRSATAYAGATRLVISATSSSATYDCITHHSVFMPRTPSLPSDSVAAA